MPPRTPAEIFSVHLPRKPAPMAIAVVITKPTIAMMTPFPVVSFSDSRTEKVPREERITATKRKAKIAGTQKYKYSTIWPPKKQEAIPIAIKISATNQGLEFKY